MVTTSSPSFTRSSKILTGPFTIQEIIEFCVVQERRATDFEAPKLWKGRSGYKWNARMRCPSKSQAVTLEFPWNWKYLKEKNGQKYLLNFTMTINSRTFRLINSFSVAGKSLGKNEGNVFPFFGGNWNNIFSSYIWALEEEEEEEEEDEKGAFLSLCHNFFFSLSKKWRWN